MSPKRTAQITLVLLVAYCVDLIWKLAHWDEMSAGLQWYVIVLALTVRFAFMAGLLWVYLKLKNNASKPT